MRDLVKKALLGGVFSAVCLSTTIASAALVFEFSESGGDMTVNYSGSLDFTGMAFSIGSVGTDSGTTIFSMSGLNGFRYNTGILIRGYASPWSSAPNFTIASTTTNSGSPLTQQISIFDTAIYLDPNDFVGDLWSGVGATTFSGVSITSIVNLNTPVVWTLSGPTADTVTWQLAATVPEPATLALFGLGLAGLGFMRRRRRTA